MTVSHNEWISLMPGRLYGTPFVSQYLLYRLSDVDCSLLLCEGKERAREPDSGEVDLHFSPSARTTLAELGGGRE
jgi:hypothetical protein